MVKESDLCLCDLTGGVRMPKGGRVSRNASERMLAISTGIWPNCGRAHPLLAKVRFEAEPRMFTLGAFKLQCDMTERETIELLVGSHGYQMLGMWELLHVWGFSRCEYCSDGDIMALGEAVVGSEVWPRSRFGETKKGHLVVDQRGCFYPTIMASSRVTVCCALTSSDSDREGPYFKEGTHIIYGGAS